MNYSFLTEQDTTPETTPSLLLDVPGIMTEYTNLQPIFTKPESPLECMAPVGSDKTAKHICDDAKLSEFPVMIHSPPKNCKYYQDSSINQTKCVEL
jgi:hypothetical protein